MVDRCASVNQAVLMAFCGLLASTQARADPPQDDQFQTDQFQDDQPQSKPKKRVVHRVDPAAQLRHTMRDEINNGLLGIVSEGTDYTVDLALALTSEQSHLRLLPIAGAGALQYVTKLYDQELHVLAGPDIQSIDDLRGKKVNFGLHDSGTYTTATAVFKAFGIEPDATNVPHPLALDKLRRGEISALVYAATKPSRLFQDIRPDENLHFLTITSNLLSNYTTTTINSNDYPELVSKDTPVNTVAVGTVLLAYNWPTKSERYQRVNRFVQAFLSHLNEIKARRPKWHDFDISASVSGWTRFPAAEQWLKKAGLTPEPDKATAQGQVPLAPKEREALFRKFAAYQRTLKPEQAALHLDPTRREALFRDFAEYR